MLTNDVTNFYAPSIPYNYLHQHNDNMSKGDKGTINQKSTMLISQNTIKKKLR